MGGHDVVGVDSLLNIEIAVRVEERFGVAFEETELRDLRTFGDLVALTHARMPARS